MEKFRDLEAKSLNGLSPKIRKKYGDEGLVSFYIERYNIDIENSKIRYLNGEGLKRISEEYGIGLGQMKFIFEFYKIQLRTQKERMEVLNKKVLPKLFEEKYGVKNPFQMKSSIEKIQRKRSEHKDEIYEKVRRTVNKKYGVDNVFQAEDVKRKIKESLTPEKRKRSAEKAAQTWKSFSKERKQEIESKRIKTLEERYGEGIKNPWQISHIVERNHSDGVKEKQLKTKIKNGHAVDYEKYSMTEKEQYYHEVKIYTSLAYREFKTIINPDGILFKNRQYGIDHILSKIDGFLHKIPPLIISHPCNLRILTTSQNSRKNLKSDQTLEELLDSIKVFNENHSQENSKFLQIFNNSQLSWECYGKASI